MVVHHQLADLCPIWKQNLKKINCCLSTTIKHSIDSGSDVISYQKFVAGLIESLYFHTRHLFCDPMQGTQGPSQRHRPRVRRISDPHYSIYSQARVQLLELDPRSWHGCHHPGVVKDPTRPEVMARVELVRRYLTPGLPVRSHGVTMFGSEHPAWPNPQRQVSELLEALHLLRVCNDVRSLCCQLSNK